MKFTGSDPARHMSAVSVNYAPTSGQELSPISCPVHPDEANKADIASGQSRKCSEGELPRVEAKAGSMKSMLAGPPVIPEGTDKAD